MRRYHSTRADLNQGFTILEIMIAVVIIGILVAIAIPTFLHLQRNSQNSRFISDLRTFSQAYETYAMRYGKWPPNTPSGEVPSVMSGELQDSHWVAINSLGGHWKWDYKPPGADHFTAGISITGITVSDAQMIEIDKKMDDGDLTKGAFFKGSDRFIFILQK